MTTPINDGGPAFPQQQDTKMPPNSDGTSTGWVSEYLGHPDPGMSLRTYAAIKLRVPDSGIDWLDDMIRQRLRDEFAGQALAAANPGDLYFGTVGKPYDPWPELAEQCYKAADAMLATRQKGDT